MHIVLLLKMLVDRYEMIRENKASYQNNDDMRSPLVIPSCAPRQEPAHVEALSENISQKPESGSNVGSFFRPPTSIGILIAEHHQGSDLD